MCKARPESQPPDCLAKEARAQKFYNLQTTARLPVEQVSLHSALRANPFPEVTDLFCRLPLSTLFYQLEAAHLGDLMRL